MYKTLILVALFFSLIASVNGQERDLCSIASAAIEDAQKIRELKKERAVTCLVRDKSRIRSYVVSAVKEQTPAERILGESVIYKLLQIVPEDFDYESGIIDLYTSQIGGYYDPKKNHFVMASWMPASMQYPIAVHELVHALQDQHFKLEKFINVQDLTSDELMARAALVEGDATAVMTDYSMKKAGMPSIKNLENTNMLLAQNVIGTEIMGSAHNAPRALLSLMVFPYSSGLRFVHYWLKKEDGYSGLNDFYLNPPKSTEEILHPEKYSKGHEDFKAAKEYKTTKEVIFKDRLGEFFISIWLNNLGLDGAKAANAAAGWGGDQVILQKVGHEKYKLNWHINWDSESDAKQFLAALNDVKGSMKFLHSIDCRAKECAIEFVD